MKRSFFFLGISIIMAFLLGFVPNIGINRDSVDILFTISGIIFSVGMSLVITSNTQNIRKSSIRKRLHQQRTDIAVGYVWNFALLSLLYVSIISIPLLGPSKILHISDNVELSPSIVFLVMSIEVNMYFILNFLHIMNLNNEIEDYTINNIS